MTTISGIEEQLKNEYGAVKGWIAAHVYWTIAGVIVLAWILGRCHVPF